MVIVRLQSIMNYTRMWCFKEKDERSRRAITIVSKAVFLFRETKVTVGFLAEYFGLFSEANELISIRERSLWRQSLKAPFVSLARCYSNLRYSDINEERQVFLSGYLTKRHEFFQCTSQNMVCCYGSSSRGRESERSAFPILTPTMYKTTRSCLGLLPLLKTCKESRRGEHIRDLLVVENGNEEVISCSL